MFEGVHMSYWFACVIVMAISFFATELYYRVKHKKKVIVRLKDKDGSERFVEIKPGRDPDVDALIEKIKRRRGAV